MKLILKIFKYLTFALVLVLVLLLSLGLVVQGRITQIFSSEVNKYSNTGISVEKLGFSLIRGFPRATVEFKNLKIEAHPSADPWIDSLMTAKNFFEADFVYASFNIRDIIQKEYTVDRITLKNASVILFKDDMGNTIKRLLKEEFRSDSSQVSFDLENIRIENTEFKYFSSKNHFLLDCTVKDAEGKLSYADEETNILVKTGFSLNNISSKDKRILKPLDKGDLDGELIIRPDSIYFKQLELLVDNHQFNIGGSILQKKRKLNLDIITGNIGPDLIMDYLVLNKDLKQNFTISELDVNLMLDFDKPAETFSARARSFIAEYAGSEYRGTASLSNILKPYIDARLSSDIDLKNIATEFSFEEVEYIDGGMHLNALLQGRVGSLKDITLDDVLKLKRRVNLHLGEVTLKLNSYRHPFENIRGNIMIAENAWADEISLKVAEQNMVLNCMIENPAGLLGKNSKTVDIKAGLWADKLDKALLIPGSDEIEKEEGQGKKGKGERTEPLIERINASLSLNADSLVVDDFFCSQFNGLINYRPGLINISSFSLLALDGSLSGNAALASNSGGDYLARAWLDISTADIHKAFTVFNNFKQEQIVAENIKGDLSGSLSISTKLDSSFKLLPPSLYVTGSYSIYDGELISFEPILKLSRFIEVAELENIVFEDLHNELLISDSRILVPSMEINSSAFNISISGEQDFSGDFEYHLSVLLSEILGKKAKNSGSYLSEFGRVEDDGLGRTNLFLKLEKEDGETKVSYDVKKLSTEIKESLQEEKQSLKTILNEEYGWYKADSLENSSETGSRKFRITWEEADSVKTVLPEQTRRKPGRKGILNKIFKADTTKKKF